MNLAWTAVRIFIVAAPFVLHVGTGDVAPMLGSSTFPAWTVVGSVAAALAATGLAGLLLYFAVEMTSISKRRAGATPRVRRRVAPTPDGANDDVACACMAVVDDRVLARREENTGDGCSSSFGRGNSDASVLMQPTLHGGYFDLSIRTTTTSTKFSDDDDDGTAPFTSKSKEKPRVETKRFV